MRRAIFMSLMFAFLNTGLRAQESSAVRRPAAGRCLERWIRAALRRRSAPLLTPRPDDRADRQHPLLCAGGAYTPQGHVMTCKSRAGPAGSRRTRCRSQPSHRWRSDGARVVVSAKHSSSAAKCCKRSTSMTRTPSAPIASRTAGASSPTYTRFSREVASCFAASTKRRRSGFCQPH